MVPPQSRRRKVADGISRHADNVNALFINAEVGSMFLAWIIYSL
jgi:hypothetical protein